MPKPSKLKTSTGLLHNEVPYTGDNPAVKGPCHIFLGGKDKDGYGITSVKSWPVKAHRYIWEFHKGEIPEGLVIDHICRVRACVNINHLRLVTGKQNSTENVVGICWMLQKQKTHCIRGHPFDEENTRINKIGRGCRACGREKARKIREKAKNKTLS